MNQPAGLKNPIFLPFFLFFVWFLITTSCIHAQLSPVWVQRYAGTGDNSDKFNAITTDANGNFYLSGYTYTNGQQKDFWVVKTDNNGDTLWMRTYNGTNNGDDEAQAIAVDASGNVYATGYTDGDKSNLDFLTIKYDTNGNQVWAAIYNNDLSSRDDKAVAIAVDSSGNVYVTGSSNQSLTNAGNNDFATIKYNASGVMQFVARKNGFGNNKDEPVAIAADNSGNCYVTGRSDSGNDDDYVTIKYNNSGIAQWTKLYDGGNGDDRPAGLVLTAAGDVIVTGRRDGGSNDDVATICYSNGGVQLWLRNFNGTGNGNDRPQAITMDGSGNIYITGESDADPSFNTNYDYLTLKYDNTGAIQWSSYYAGTGAGADHAAAIAVDPNGNVFVTGQSDSDPTATVNDEMVTIKYDNTGTEQWVRINAGTSNLEDGGYGMVLDNSLHPVIAGKLDYTGPQQDAELVKYDQAGTTVFSKTWNGPGDFSDNSFSVKTDGSGNVFIAGYAFVRDQNRDLLIRKYDSGGNVLKTFLYNGSKNDEDEATDMILDAAGNVYVTGFSKNSGVSSDFVTMKLNNNLDTSWVRTYNYTANESDKAVSIALDGSNNVYVTGYSDNDPRDTVDSYDIVTIKYNSIGSSQWTNRYNSLSNGDDKPVKVLVDGNGNADVTGKSWNGANDDVVTIQYGSTGSQQWLSTFNGAANGDDKAASMVLDNSGSIYIAGSSFSGSNFEDFLLLKYNQAGSQQYFQTFNGSGNDEDKAFTISLDNGGNVILGGPSDSDPSPLVKNFDYVTVKYDNAGNYQWSANYNGSSGTDDIPACMALDALGNIYVAGESENGLSANPNKDFSLVGYRPSGAQFLYAVYDGPSAGTDGANAITLNGPVLYLTGGSNGGVTQKDIATIQYDITSGIQNQNQQAGSGAFLFPNPVSSTAVIHLSNQATPVINLTVYVYDNSGKQLQVPVKTDGNSILVETKELAGGIYFYRIQTNGNPIASGKFSKQ